MKLGISNLAWSAGDDARVAPILAAAGVANVDLALGRYQIGAGWPDPQAVDHLRRWWADFGITIGGLQSLFFGRPDLNIFGAPDIRTDLLVRFAEVCQIGERLGGSKLVFGSPASRRRGAMADAEAWTLAIDFLRAAGEIAATHNTVVCVEAAPVVYGGDFAVTTDEAAAWVEAAAHPAVRLQLDTGIAALGGENFARLVARYAPIVGHVHLSEPGLVPLGEGPTDHTACAAALRAHRPDRRVTIEMLASTGEDAIPALRRALACAAHAYGDR